MSTRRQLLTGSACLGAALLLGPLRSPARARVPPPQAPAPFRPVVPALSRDRIVRRVVGLRPYRPQGFDVSVETIAGKTVLHNYGHGGAGITLSWGTALLVLERIRALGLEGPVAVLGCGAVGLATARLLQEQGLPVTLHASHFPPQVTSSVAGASWYPSLVVSSDLRTEAFESLLSRALHYSHQRFSAMVGRGLGVHRRPHLVLGSAPPEPGWRDRLLADLLPAPVEMTDRGLPFRAASVGLTQRLFIETQTYLPAMVAAVRRGGARLVRRSFSSAADLASLQETVVVNCTGLGSAGLFGKNDLVPVQGQLTVLKADPRVGYTLSAGELYLHPRADGLLLGGTHEFGAARPSFDPHAEERLLEIFRRISPG